MSTKVYTSKYFDLIEQLMHYVTKNGSGVKELPSNASFVAFSNKDTELNEYTQRILDSLIEDKEDKPIVKAEQLKNSSASWKFTTITP